MKPWKDGAPKLWGTYFIELDGSDLARLCVFSSAGFKFIGDPEAYSGRLFTIKRHKKVPHPYNDQDNMYQTVSDTMNRLYTLRGGNGKRESAFAYNDFFRFILTQPNPFLNSKHGNDD